MLPLSLHAALPISPAAHPTSTVVGCVPASVTVNSGSVCTATVTDTSATGATTRTGTVLFTTDRARTFSLPWTSCSLSAGAAGTASCAVTYTPTVVVTVTHSISFSFVPTSHHAPTIPTRRSSDLSCGSSYFACCRLCSRVCDCQQWLCLYCYCHRHFRYGCYNSDWHSSVHNRQS